MRVGAVEERYATYRFSIELAKSAIGSRFSLQHPELRIELVNRLELEEEQLLIEGRLFGPGAAGVGPEILGYPEVIRLELRAEGPDVAYFRLTMALPEVLRVVRRHRILTRYPVIVERGRMRFETITTPSQVRAALAEFRARVGDAEIEAVRHGPVVLGQLGLTPAQELVFRIAMSEGYFDVPRRTSLTRLAGRLGRSVSSTSETLARIRKQLTDSAIRLAQVPGPTLT